MSRRFSRGSLDGYKLYTAVLLFCTFLLCYPRVNMESPYLHSRLNSNVTGVLDLPSYFKPYSETVQSIYPKNKKFKNNHIKSYLGIDDSEFEQLKSTFAISKFSWKNIPLKKMVVPVKGFQPDFNLYEIPKEPKLKSLRNLETLHLKQIEQRYLKRRKCLVKYPGEVSYDDIPEVGDNTLKDRIKLFTDYILTLRVYLPSVHHSFSANKRTRTLQVSQELLVCGNIYLDTLRDRILCEEDFTPADGDVSKNPFAPTAIINKNMYRSAMFFIDNIFYVDGRYPGNRDYSEVIKDWAKGKKLDLKETKLMENTKFNSFKVRLGYPYLFMHQGNCEHIIIFTDARLIGPRDFLVSSAYPVMKSHSSLRGKQCATCTKKTAKFIVIGCERLPMAKAYLCSLCLFQYCYIDGKKIEDFTVYKYVHRVALF